MSGISAKTPFDESDKVITLINNVLSPHGFNRLIITLKFSFSLNLSSTSFWKGYPSKKQRYIFLFDFQNQPIRILTFGLHLFLTYKICRIYQLPF